MERALTMYKGDGVSPRINPVALRDQFKPIRIGENLLAKYNGR